MTISNEAVEAGLAAWGKWPVGVSPKEQMTSILEAAAGIIRAECLEEAADELHKYSPPYGNWLRARAAAERGRQ